MPLDFVMWNGSTIGFDEGVPKPVPLARMKTVKRPAEITDVGIDVANEGIHSLWVHQPAVIGFAFKLFHKPF